MAKLYLGCPVWSCTTWPGHFLSSKAKKSDYLREYSSVFNTVEGNSTFYGLPSLNTVHRWADDTPDGFQFCLKFPQVISHERQLLNVESETRAFVDILRILQDARRLGPSFLQLSPSFDRTQFSALAAYLKRVVSDDIPMAVEVRHPDYFDEGPVEQSLDELLTSLQVDRVLFDSRALFSLPPADAYEEESQRRKPRSPWRRTVTGQNPFVRFVGRNRVEETHNWITEWAPQIIDWMRAGLTPYIFVHTPDDFLAPYLSRAVYEELRRLDGDIKPSQLWPAEREQQRDARQKRLF